MSLSATAEAEKILFAANQKLADGNVSEALDMLSDLTAISPEFGKAFLAIANIYTFNFSDLKSGEQNFKKAIALLPEHAPAYLAYAELLLQQERFTEAMAMLNKSLEITGVKKDKAYFLFATMYELQGKFEDALSFYKKGITSTLSNDLLASCEKAIQRCEIKKKYI